MTLSWHGKRIAYYSNPSRRELLALCEGNHFIWQRSSNVALWCFLCCKPHQAVEQTILLTVIWDTMTYMLCHYNDLWFVILCGKLNLWSSHPKTDIPYIFNIKFHLPRCEIALRWISLDLSDDKSALVQVMAWCHQATSHYLNQCWPRSLPPYGVIRLQMN